MRILPFADPSTHAPLTEGSGGYHSPSGALFPVKDGRPTFISSTLAEHMDDERSGIVNRIKTFLRHYPRLYVGLIAIMSPVCFTGLSAEKFLRRFGPAQLLISIGAGVHRYGKDIVNIDIFPYSEVDVVADAMALPFVDGSIDGIVCEYLLEHVPEPQRVVDEIVRVLRPGGEAYLAVPFVYPFHACPNDFYRWSGEGFKQLCKNAEVVAIGSRSGPTSALTAQLVTWTAIVLSFGNEAVYGVLSAVLQLVFFPIKFLDLLLQWYPTTIHGTASWYIVIRKAFDSRIR